MIALLFLAAADLARLTDTKLTVAQRNDACYELRGNREPEVVAAMRDGLTDEVIRSCAARNLIEIRAGEALLAMANHESPDVRAVAVDSLARLTDDRYLPVFEKAARDANMAVNVAAMQGFALLSTPATLESLLRLGAGSDPVGLMALEQTIRFHDRRTLKRGRALIGSSEIPAQLAAIRILAELGEPEDTAALAPLAASVEQLTAGGRGFGFMPAISLGRAARVAISRIETRAKENYKSDKTTRLSGLSPASSRK
ncbi:MAG: HEAT repeat domain-containing protein [Bryobacteraceae bacterium]|nr:HEAT repeat domain-containing protein [Bryobacteraceae bacterium]